MATDDPRDGTLEERFHAELSSGTVESDRISVVVTESTPSRLPGRLLLWAADASSEPVERDAALDAAIALELACLHHYLHAIPRRDGELRSPAAGSAYADDPVAALLDGDLLLARAYALLPSTGDARTTAEDCYRLLSRRSVECYRRAVDRAEGSSSSPLLPLVGAAVRIGAALGELDGSDRSSVERAARSLGGVVPVRTPTGTSPPSVERAELESRVAALADAVRGRPPRRLDRLVGESIPGDREP